MTLEATEILLDKKSNELKRLCDKLVDLPHHQSLYVLKKSFGAPRFNYVLRTSPCFKSHKLQLLDNILRDSVETILNVQLSDTKWSQACLPVKKGRPRNSES